MRPNEITIAPVDADVDGICESQTLGAAGDLLINGALATDGIATISPAMEVVITVAADEDGTNATIEGRDSDAHPQAVTVALPATGDVKTDGLGFSEVSKVSVDAALTGNVTVGTITPVYSKTVPLDWKRNSSAQLYVDITGTLTFTVEETYDDLEQWNRLAGIQGRVHWVPITALTSKSADTGAPARVAATATRMRIESFTVPATAVFKIVQPLGD